MVRNKDRYLYMEDSLKKKWHTCLHDVKLTLTHTYTHHVCWSASHPPFKPPLGLGGLEEANSGDLLYTQITSSPPCPYLPAFLPFILSFIWAIFLFALPPFTSDKLLCKSVECTQAKDLDEVSLFCWLKGTSLSFFLSFGYEHGKKRPSWQSDKESFNERDTKRWGKKGRKSWDNIWQWFTYSWHLKERYGLSDLVKGKAGVSVCQNYLCFCVCMNVWEG